MISGLFFCCAQFSKWQSLRVQCRAKRIVAGMLPHTGRVPCLCVVAAFVGNGGLHTENVRASQLVSPLLTQLQTLFVLARYGSPPDADGDGVWDADDACPFIVGLAEYQGCPAGIDNDFTLHIVDQAKSGLCPNNKPSCKLTGESVEVKVFDSAIVGDPDPGTYDQVFENSTGLVSFCTGAGSCTDGVPAVGDYLAIARYADADGTVFTGRNVAAADFVDGLATRKFQVIKLIKKNGDIQFNGGKMTVLTGSYLEIISPDYAMWEEGVTDYVYPYIFTGDSDWEVDVCAEVPEGYEIVGVYDADGNLVSTTDCVQTVVANDTKVVAFDVNDLQSPPPHVKAKFKIKHKGKHHKFDLDTPGHREGRDKPGKGKGRKD